MFLLPKRKKNKPQEEIERLYIEIGQHIAYYLQSKFRFSKELAEDITQQTFLDVMPHIENISNKEAYIFSAAKHLAYKEIEKIKKTISFTEQYGDNGQSDQILLDEPSNSIDMMEEMLCLQRCMEKALAQYKQEYPKALCPLLVTLSEFKSLISIEDIANMLSQTVRETKKCLAQCRSEMKRYKNWGAYQKKYGLDTLCWLIIKLRQLGFTIKEISQIIGKSEIAIRQDVSRCRKKGLPDAEKNCRKECR
jgi:DNA-directed RNA polymerase specialized sigma24 family protein